MTKQEQLNKMIGKIIHYRQKGGEFTTAKISIGLLCDDGTFVQDSGTDILYNTIDRALDERGTPEEFMGKRMNLGKHIGGNYTTDDSAVIVVGLLLKECQTFIRGNEASELVAYSQPILAEIFKE